MTELSDYKRLVETPMIRNHQATVAEFRSALEAKDAEIAIAIAERNSWADMVAKIVAAVPLDKTLEHSQTVGDLISYFKSLPARITSLERQLAEETERCARVAYSEPVYMGNDGPLSPGSPYDRGRFDAAAAIRGGAK